MHQVCIRGAPRNIYETGMYLLLYLLICRLVNCWVRVFAAQVLWFAGGGGPGGTSPLIWRLTFPM